MTQKLKNDQIPPGEDWQIPTLLNNWVPFGEDWPSPAYRKDPYGVVHLRGMVKNGTVDSDIFTLPVGYRPALATHTTVPGGDSTADTTIHIYTDGRVHQRTGTNAWLGLDGIKFTPDQ